MSLKDRIQGGCSVSGGNGGALWDSHSIVGDWVSRKIVFGTDFKYFTQTVQLQRDT